MAKDQSREHSVTSTPSAPEKKPYRTPRLVEYGDLRTITRGKGGNMSDGTGQPPTKK